MTETPTDPLPEENAPNRFSAQQIVHRVLTPDLLSILASIGLALLIGAGLISIMGVSPLRAYAALLDGAFGNLNSLAETLLVATPLALAGVGVAVAFRAGVFNVGAEGQLYLGAITATYVGLTFDQLPAGLLIPLMLAAGMFAGAAWAAVAGVLKVWLNASEMINTIMMNYVAIFLVNYLLHGPLQEPNSPLGQTSPLPVQGLLPVILLRTRLHAGLLIAVFAAVVMYLILYHTTWGFRIKVVGKNLLAARTAGIPVRWVLLSSLMVSGALAGLAGFSEAAGVQHRMIENISPGYGYTAIVVALLGQLNPLGVLAAAILFGALQVGATTMSSAVGVPASVVSVIQYLIVLLLIGRGVFGLLRQKLQPASARGRDEHS